MLFRSEEDFAGNIEIIKKGIRNEPEIAKQWANNEVITSLSNERTFLGCIRRDEYITVLFKQKSTKVLGEYLGRLVLGEEDGEVKIFGATIF